MKHILFLFVDGIGLGVDDPAINPFVAASLPTLNGLTNSKKWIKDSGRQVSERAVFIPTDPLLGVEGRPQSGSSQAVILTGKNVPEMLGHHYGPLPNEPIRKLLDEDNFFITLKQRGKSADLLSAYPPQRLEGIASGKRLPSSIQYAAIASGKSLHNQEDVFAGHALTSEYTGQSWRDFLDIPQTPLYTPQEAGRLLVQLSRLYDFAFHSHWMTDYVGHRGSFEQGVELLEILDGVLAGILEVWDDDEGLVILTSDHGNMEHIGNRKHTENDVPTLIIGSDKDTFADGFATLMDFVPRMEQYLSEV